VRNRIPLGQKSAPKTFFKKIKSFFQFFKKKRRKTKRKKKQKKKQKNK
jgi:hypothetical protein